MKLFKTFFITFMASILALGISSAELNIATLDPQAALFSTNVAKKELEELENSDEWKEVVEELQAKASEAREIQEKTQKERRVPGAITSSPGTTKAEAGRNGCQE